jgi:hypothetical protein
MCSVPIEVPPADRARWLAELAQALDEAQRLFRQLDVRTIPRADAFELYMRIEAARLEVQSLRLSRSLRERAEMPPHRMKLVKAPGASRRRR